MKFAIATLAGAGLWSLLEYVLHRFDGHGMRGKTRFSREHLAHHADPRTFAPTAYKVAAAVPVITFLAVASVAAVGSAGAFFTGAFTGAYVGYEVIHRRLHTHPPRGPYGRWARRHHFAHHYLAPDANHGVTSPLWDWVFGTLVQPEGALRVPRKQVPRWLVDARTGEVHPRLRPDYQIAVRKRANA